MICIVIAVIIVILNTGSSYFIYVATGQNFIVTVRQKLLRHVVCLMSWLIRYSRITRTTVCHSVLVLFGLDVQYIFIAFLMHRHCLLDIRKASNL